VFKPLALDPPRNLPSVIRAGVVVPTVSPYSPQQNSSARINRGTGTETSDSLKDSDGITTTALVIIIGSSVLAVLFCVLRKVLYALRCPRRAEQGHAKWLKKIISKKPMLRATASFENNSDVSRVRVPKQDIYRA
jgi:hypothetical protein